jgi:uncharacterized membrane protein
MSWYTFLLFVHIASAVAWVGGGLMVQFFGLRALRAGPERVAVLALDIEWIAPRLLVPSSLLVLVSGSCSWSKGRGLSATRGSRSNSCCCS